MWRLTCAILAAVVAVGAADVTPRSGDQLVSVVTSKCGDMGCVKGYVLEYLDNILGLQSEGRSVQVLKFRVFLEKVTDQRLFRRTLTMPSTSAPLAYWKLKSLSCEFQKSLLRTPTLFTTP